MAPAAKKPVYIEHPSMDELLDDQYCWLATHAETCKVDGCEQCWRMNRLKEILMMPFRREPEYSRAEQIANRKAKGASK